MRFKNAYLETIALALIACMLISFSELSLNLSLQKWAFHSGLWIPKGLVIRFVIASYGFVIIMMALTSYFSIRYHGTTLFALSVHGARSVANEARHSYEWLCKATRIRDAMVWIVLISAVGAVVRAYFLAKPMRYDESFSFLNFINNGFSDLFYYPLPNNHVLHTLLAKLSVEVFGSHPAAIRMPAFIAGTLVIPTTFCLSRLLTDNGQAGFLASGAAAVFPYLILYDTMARGYSLLVLMSLCMAILGFRFFERPSASLCFLISLIISLGLWLMPSFLFPATGLFLWILAMLMRQGRNPVWVLAHVLMPCSIMTIGLTGFFYTPVIIRNNGIYAITANRFVRGLPWSEFLNQLPSHLSYCIKQFTRDIPAALILSGILLFVIGFIFLIRDRRWEACKLFPSIIFGGAVVLFLKHAIPFDRTWIYLIPFVLSFIDVGFVGIIKSANVYVRSIILLLAGSVAVIMMNHNLIDSYPDTGNFPEASTVVKVLTFYAHPGDQLAVKCPADAPVQFYLWRQSILHPKKPREDADRPKKFFIVKKSSYSLKDLAAKDARKLLEIGDAELFESDLKQGG